MSVNNNLQPVFITGHPRSGTSLLYRTLLKHRSFSPKELCMEETKIFRYAFLALLEGADTESLKKYMLNDEELFQQFLRSIEPERRFQHLFKTVRLPSILLDDFTAWKLAKNATVIRKYFKYALEARECQRIVEKTPIHLLNHQRITHTFPEASILIIVRHPIDVYSSYRKRLKEHPEMSWLNMSIEEFTEQYRRYSTAAERIKKSPLTYQFRYEDFVHAPETEFRKICDFLNEPFEERPIREDAPSLKIEGVNPNLSKSIRKKTKSWSDYINEKEAQEIEDELREEMYRYQYESVFRRT